jgi:hypothetical protein
MLAPMQLKTASQTLLHHPSSMLSLERVNIHSQNTISNELIKTIFL